MRLSAAGSVWARRMRLRMPGLNFMQVCRVQLTQLQKLSQKELLNTILMLIATTTDMNTTEIVVTTTAPSITAKETEPILRGADQCFHIAIIGGGEQ